LEPVEAKLHIIDVRIEFQKHIWETSEHVEGQQGYFRLPLGLRLPYSSNNLVITYDAIDLRSPEKVRYQWKLDGYTDEWSQIEERNAVTLTNLPSGSYTFMVRACNGDGIWNQEPATFQFTVLPPFWLTWWFIALASVATVGFIILIIKVRENRLQAEKLRLQNMVDERTKELREEKERSDELLLNILPYETAEELKLKGYASVQQYDRVSVLFTDFVGFTNITEGISHQQLVSALDEHFRMFDEVMDKYGIEKIKTIGDAYMAAGGIPTRTITNPLSVVAAGLEMVHRLAELNETKRLKGEQAWQLRLGIHTGSVISGVVGKNKFAFDIWGDAVNTAARMESSGEVMKVNVSGSTYELVKEYFECTPRGKIKAKNKGEIEMYFVDRLKPEFSETSNGLVANATFMVIVSKDGKKFSMPN
jgi:class 3 adenylate cyclase